jgi:hypothetical protein
MPTVTTCFYSMDDILLKVQLLTRLLPPASMVLLSVHCAPFSSSALLPDSMAAFLVLLLLSPRNTGMAGPTGHIHWEPSPSLNATWSHQQVLETTTVACAIQSGYVPDMPGLADKSNTRSAPKMMTLHVHTMHNVWPVALVT